MDTETSESIARAVTSNPTSFLSMNSTMKLPLRTILKIGLPAACAHACYDAIVVVHCSFL